MQGYLIIADETVALELRPGPRLPDGRVIALSDDEVQVGGARWPVSVARDGNRVWVHLDGRIFELIWQPAADHHARAADADAGTIYLAPMPGSVVSVLVAPGDPMREGDAMMVIESMKLETTIRAAREGVVASVGMGIGATFERGAMLVSLAEKQDA